MNKNIFFFRVKMPAIRESMEFSWFCFTKVIKCIKFYILWYASYDALVKIQHVPELKNFIVHLLFGANCAVWRRDINCFYISTVCHFICWIMALSNMIWGMAILNTIFLVFCESYRYCFILIFSTSWSQILIYSSFQSITAIYKIYFLSVLTVHSFVFPDLMRDLNKVCTYISICYYFMYIHNGRINFTVSMMFMYTDLGEEAFYFLAIYGFLFCVIIAFPLEDLQIPYSPYCHVACMTVLFYGNYA